MKVLEQTLTKLILQELPWIVVLIGVVFLLVGLSVAFSGQLLGLLFTAIGILSLVFMAEVVTCTFDKTLGCMNLKRRGLFKTKVIEHPIEEISGVQLEESRDSESSTYRVSLVLVSGKRVPLTSYYSTGLRGKQKTAQDIAAFLGVNNYRI